VNSATLAMIQDARVSTEGDEDCNMEGRTLADRSRIDQSLGPQPSSARAR
jgi:hypothetical protein